MRSTEQLKRREILVKARALIEKPENWCQGISALNRKGEAVDQQSGNAFAFCAIGAITRIEPFSYHGAQSAVAKAANTSFLHVFNDNHTHAEVLNAFDKAIADCS